MSTCMICGQYAEVKYVPGVIVQNESGRENRYVAPYTPRPQFGERFVAKCEIRRIQCGCSDGPPYRHP